MRAAGHAPWPWFSRSCAGCHNEGRVVPLAKIGTDPLLAERTASDAAPQRAWFNASEYGKSAHLDATRGYVAQPLTGIWATAPYLHNGSVPTLWALLDSTQRPKRWRRTFKSSDYDERAVGWRYSMPQTPKEAGDTTLYDTEVPGYSNAGHVFGDALSAEDRRAVFEYLKTL